MKIRALVAADWSEIQEIYREGIESGDATFEVEVPDWQTWDASRHPLVRLVAEDESGITGFAAVSPASERSVYAGVAEVMVYVAARVRGQGLGTELMRALVDASEDAGIWTLQASIFPENVPSIRAHERVGFRVLGRRDRIGRFHDGRWRDTVVMERRSAVVGLD